MTAQDVIDSARIRLLDGNAGAYRWPDEELLQYVNDGQREMTQRRPEVNGFYDDNSNTWQSRTVTDAASTSAILAVADRFRPALAGYVVYRALDRDNADQANMNRAQLAFAAYERLMFTL